MSKLLPRGTVTLLLADVEGSTWLWETHPETTWVLPWRASTKPCLV